MKKFLEVLLKGIFLSGVIIVTNYLSQVENIFEVLDQKIIPVVVAIIGALGSLFSMIKPIINKLTESDNNMEDALSELKEYMNENNTLKRNLEIANAKTDMLRKDLENIMTILKIGFSQNEEFVKKGKANKICRCVNDKKDET